MAKLRVHNFTISLDGYGAGTNQRLDKPFGDGIDGLHRWMFATRFGREMLGEDGGSEGVDNDFASRFHDNVGATIMGRHMFGPVRGPWPDESWQGWWGPNPPYHHDVFVLTHHARPSVPMEGGTTFHFVDDTPEAVLERAFAAADGKDVAVGGGVSTVRQFLRARLIDDLHVVIAPLLVGAGERLWESLGDGLAGYEVAEFVPSETVTHVRIVKKP
jgi:dihydrofolate reductase